MKNSVKVWGGLGLIALAIMVIAVRFNDRQGWVIGFVLSASVVSFVYFFDELRLLRVFKLQEIEGQDAWGVIRMAERLAAKFELPPPRIFLLDINAPTAFALGRNRNDGRIMLSQSLVQRLAPDELEAVVAFLLARISRMDTFAATAATAAAAPLAGLAQLIDNYIFLQLLRPHDRPNRLRPASALVSPLVASILRLTLSRRSFLEADALAAKHTEKPEALAQALWKLHAYSTTHPIRIPPVNAHLFIVNPLTCCFWDRYFQLQPPLERRIRRLVGHYPI